MVGGGEVGCGICADMVGCGIGADMVGCGVGAGMVGCAKVGAGAIGVIGAGEG